MRILALAPEKNRGIYYWAMVDIRNKPVESSEAGVLGAIRERPGSGRFSSDLVMRLRLNWGLAIDESKSGDLCDVPAERLFAEICT